MSKKTKLILELISFTVATVVITLTIMPWIFKGLKLWGQYMDWVIKL